MSGGTFDYKQYELGRIADEIQERLDQQGKEIPRRERYLQDEHYEKYPEDRLYPTYSQKVQERFKEAIKVILIAKVYIHRVDYFLAGDDGEDSFLRNLKNDLKKL